MPKQREIAAGRGEEEEASPHKWLQSRKDITTLFLLLLCLPWGGGLLVYIFYTYTLAVLDKCIDNLDHHTHTTLVFVNLSPSPPSCFLSLPSFFIFLLPHQKVSHHQTTLSILHSAYCQQSPSSLSHTQLHSDRLFTSTPQATKRQ